jgi:Putative beta-barrel porin 2
VAAVGWAWARAIVLATIHENRILSRVLRASGRILACLLTLLILIATVTESRAQPSVPGLEVFYSKPEPLAATIERTKTDPRPTTTEGAYQLFDWLLYAGAGWGGAYDSNVNATPVNQQSVYGAQFQPSLIAERNTGIQRTLLYLNGDVRYYPSINRTDLAGTRIGLVHVWEIQRDLIFRAQMQAAQVQVGSSFTNFLTSGIFATTPVNYTQIFGSSSLQKEFGSFFTAIGGSVTGNKYQDTTDNLGNVINEQFQNGTVSTLNGRVGYHISPIIYTYIEPSVNWTQYQASNLDSHGYRVVGGAGSDLISLFRGEIFAGYLRQKFDNPTIGVVNSPVVGGRLSWFPTRFLTFTVSADETFGTTDFNALAFTPGSPTKITTVNVNGNWDFSSRFAFAAGFSNQQLNYLDSFRRDDFAVIRAGIIYKVTPGLGIQLGYAHQHLYSNFPGAPYSRDLVTLGGNTKF